eukprot:9469595-Pyramimonas_sp.AAC.2
MPPAGVGPIMLRRLARFAVLLESWARSWAPSLFSKPIACSDFDDWMDWGTEFTSRVFQCWAFCGCLLPLKGRCRRGAFSAPACVMPRGTVRRWGGLDSPITSRLHGARPVLRGCWH